MSDNTFQFQGKMWRVVQQRGDVMSAEIVPPPEPKKPNAFEELNFRVREIHSGPYIGTASWYEKLLIAAVEAALNLAEEKIEKRVADVREVIAFSNTNGHEWMTRLQSRIEHLEHRVYPQPPKDQL